MAARSKNNCENKLVVDITLVYWNVSCRPVNVASIDRGVVSIWHMPGAEQRAEHGCDSLLNCSILLLLQLGQVLTRIDEMSRLQVREGETGCIDVYKGRT